MIVEKSMHPAYLSNTYLVADRPGGHGVLIDSGAPMDPILRRCEALRLEVTHIVCTHHHIDHVQNNLAYRERFSCTIAGPALERDVIPGLELPLEDGMTVTSGELTLRAVHVPGHTDGQMSFVANEECVFTGDTLFKRTVGGTRAPRHTTFEDIRHSIMNVLMTLPRDMSVYPGHTDPTTIGEEWEHNPFIRVWRELDPPDRRPCRALGEDATLMLSAPDYDGGTKCWVQFTKSGIMDIVPGSRTEILS